MEKDERLPLHRMEQSYTTTHRALRLFLVVLLLGVFPLWYLSRDTPLPVRSPLLEGHARVPLEIHIISKCPDTRDALRKLVIPTMEQVGPLVDFTMSFIGNATDDDGVSCKHGETECLGNMIELCAAHLYPDPKIYLGFTMCLSRDYPKIPKEDYVEGCALEHGVEFGKLNGCMSRHDGQFGIDLLRDSFNRSKSVGAKKSCTVRLDGKVWCIRDNGEWTDCQKDGQKPKTLIKEIEGLYQNSTARIS